MSVRFEVRSKVRGEQLVLRVQIIVHVFLQMYMGCLEKKCVLMIGGFGYLLVLLDFLGKLLVGTCVRVVGYQFWKSFGIFFSMKKFYVYYSILQ